MIEVVTAYEYGICIGVTFEHLFVIAVEFDVRKISSALLHYFEKCIIRLAGSNDLPAAHIAHTSEKKRSVRTSAAGDNYFVTFHIRYSLQ